MTEAEWEARLIADSPEGEAASRVVWTCMYVYTCAL